MPSARCRCAAINGTCADCLQSAPPWFYTLSDGSTIYVLPEGRGAARLYQEPAREVPNAED